MAAALAVSRCVRPGGASDWLQLPYLSEYTMEISSNIAHSGYSLPELRSPRAIWRPSDVLELSPGVLFGWPRQALKLSPPIS